MRNATYGFKLSSGGLLASEQFLALTTSLFTMANKMATALTGLHDNCAK